MEEGWVEVAPPEGRKGAMYYLYFPLDYFAPVSDDRRAYEEIKRRELLPVFGWLAPGVVVLTSLTDLHGFGLIVFLALEAGGLALVARAHLKLAWNQVAEITLNLWLHMLVVMVVVGAGAHFVGGLGDGGGADLDP